MVCSQYGINLTHSSTGRENRAHVVARGKAALHNCFIQRTLSDLVRYADKKS